MCRRRKAPIAEVDGTVRLEDDGNFYTITIIPDDGSDEVVYEKLSKRQGLDVPRRATFIERHLRDGDHVERRPAAPARVPLIRTRCCACWVAVACSST